jgi:hypothetical protein
LRRSIIETAFSVERGLTGHPNGSQQCQLVQSQASGSQQLDPMAHPWRGVVDCRDCFGTAITVSSLRQRAMNTSGRELETTTLLLVGHFDKQLGEFGVVQTKSLCILICRGSIPVNAPSKV